MIHSLYLLMENPEYSKQSWLFNISNPETFLPLFREGLSPQYGQTEMLSINGKRTTKKKIHRQNPQQYDLLNESQANSIFIDASLDINIDLQNR